MTFPAAISDNQLGFLSDLSTKINWYLLIWSNPVVMRARVNQTTFGDSYATLTFDQTTPSFDSGSYTDAIEGYLVYLSKTTSIHDHYMTSGPLRLRSDSSATTLFIEFTSYTIADDDYIFVVKDTRFKTRHPIDTRDTGGALYIDYDVQFQVPPPVISNIKTAYFGVIKNSVGYYDLVINPSATPVTPSVTISTWSLILDAGSQIAFNSSTGATTIRYTMPGNYMPRWKVFDSNGKTQWFSPHVFIDNEDLKNVVNLNILGGSISYEVDGGGIASVPVFDGIENVLDENFAAIYADSYPDTGGNDIIFVGNFASDRLTGEINAQFGNIQSGDFELIGIGEQMRLTTNFSWVFTNKAAPANFQELQNATLWRVVATYLLFLTNLNNMYSLSFDDTSDDYQSRLFPIETSNVLDAMSFIMERNKSQFDYSPDGSIRMVRAAIFLPDADRNSLTTVANWKKDYYAAKSEDGLLWEKQHSHLFSTARLTIGIGWYNTTTQQLDLLLAYVPGVVAAGGQGTAELNGQLLETDLTEDNAKIEARQRAADSYASSQPIDTLPVELPDIYAKHISPSVSVWHTHEIAAKDNLRNQAYDSNTRWLLTAMTIDIDIINSRALLSTVFQVETSDLGFGVILADPPPDVLYDTPVIPTTPSVPNFPELPDPKIPTGGGGGADDPPIKPKDTGTTTGAEDPLVGGLDSTGFGSTLMIWNESSVFSIENFGINTPPVYRNVQVPLGSGLVIKECAWDRLTGIKRGGYIVANNEDIDDPETGVYYNSDMLTYGAWVTSDLDDMLANSVRAHNKNTSTIYGQYKEFVAGAATYYFLGASISGGPTNNGIDGGTGIPLIGRALDDSSDVHIAPIAHAVGLYDPDNDWFAENSSDDTEGGRTCEVIWPIPPGVTITNVIVRMSYNRGSGGGGEKNYGMSIDGVRLASSSWGTAPSELNLNSGAISISGASELQLHNSRDRNAGGGFVRIIGLRIQLQGEADHACTRTSFDTAETYEPAKDVGLMDLGDGSFDVRFGQSVFAAKNEQVKRAALAGQGFFFNADQGSTPSQYAKAIWKFGKDDYLLAPDGGSVGLYKIVDDVRSDITPNDGSANGFAVGIGSLAMRNNSTQDIWFLATFGGITKLAYTSNQGVSWNFNTEMTGDAKWVVVNPRSKDEAIEVYVSDGDKILYGVQAAGGTLTFDEYDGPVSLAEGLAVL